ncbi:MAG: DNA processing protein DprA [Bacteroidia bacterium]|nr:MAG: DNA processing protein DprA [Bacteroidia bacterium]
MNTGSGSITPEQFYTLALSQIKNVGSVIGKNLIAAFGSAESIFKSKKHQLVKVPGVGEVIANEILKSKDEALKFAEQECKKIEQYKLSICCYADENYPTRLKFYNDSPLVFYYSGETVWNAEKTVAIVGTRKPTIYGKDLVIKFIEGIRQTNAVIVSGLAYGIDAIAHQEALNNGLKTIAVLGNGLPDIYPASHTSLAKEIIENGAVLSEYPIKSEPDAINFPKRNRIVAALSDAVVVVESKVEGGSMITASIANSYNKDVFAFPGRANDLYSSGCNALIKLNKAQMIESADDFLYFMNWVKDDKKAQNTTPSLPIALSPEQEKIINLLREKNKLHIDEISYYSELPGSQLSMILLEMEMNNWIRALPGKMYEVSI